MKTLKQIREHKRKIIRSKISVQFKKKFRCAVTLSDAEQDECFKHWLQQKYQKHCGECDIFKELLEELDQ